MTRREMKQRIRELEKRVAHLEERWSAFGAEVPQWTQDEWTTPLLPNDLRPTWPPLGENGSGSNIN